MGYDKDKMQIPDSLQKFTKELPGRFAAGEFDDERSDRVSRELEGFNKALKKQWHLLNLHGLLQSPLFCAVHN